MKRIIFFLSLVLLGQGNAWSQTQINLDDQCWQTVTSNVFLWHCAGQYLPASGAKYNLQLTVVEAPRSVLVFDSGATADIGRAAARAIQSKFNNKQVWVVDSQPRPEHVLGNIGFREVFASNGQDQTDFNQHFLAGTKTANLMAQRCPQCIQMLGEQMGLNTVQGTEPVVPKGLLPGSKGHFGYFDANWINWKYELLKDVQSEQALVARSDAANVYWLGSVVQPTRIPDLKDGLVLNQIQFLGRLVYDQHPVQFYIGSYGIVSTDWIKKNFEYYANLQEAVYVAREEGTSEVEIVDSLTKALKDQYPDLTEPEIEVEQLNVQRVYRQLENSSF